MPFTLFLSSLRFTHSNELRWLDTVFQGQYFLSLSINYFQKIATIAVLDKDEKFFMIRVAMTSGLS